MAFFKFRFPGQNPVAAAEGTAVPASSLEAVRRQARYRLIGAALLVLVVVVVFPIVFDTQPRPVAVDTPIFVPDRQGAPSLSAGALPASQAPARPLVTPEVAPAASQAMAMASDVPERETILPSTPAKPQALTGALTGSQARESQAQTAKVPEKTPLPDKPAAPAKVVDAHDNGTRAKALLDGANPADKSAAVDRHVLQVGAYTDSDKAREVRRKLEQAGLKTYTQAIDNKDGKRVIRVRIGPFDSKAEAEKAAARVRKLDLPVSLLRL